MLNMTIWLAIAQVIWIDVLLSGDNAVVIALACRNLTGRQQTLGIVLGGAAAIVMRIIFTGAVSQLMELPYLRMVGAAALVYVAAKMAIGSDNNPEVSQHSRLISAVGTIVVADLIMSLDNMVAVAAVAQGSWLVLGLGLVISIPIIIVGATIITKVVTKYPILVWAGACLLGWIAIELFLSDKSLNTFIWRN